MNSELFQRVNLKIDSYEDEMINMMKGLVPIRAISPIYGGEGEMRKARYLEPILNETFDEIEWINVPDITNKDVTRPNIVCKIFGGDRTKTIWFMVHMDVVPIGNESKWETPPFEAAVKDGKIYGRGTEDNNQALISTLYAIKALKDEGVKPPHNIGLLLVSDEETGSNLGIKYILKTKAHIFKKTDWFLVPDYGTPSGDLIEIAEKGISRFRVIFKGKQIHVYRANEGINSNRVMANFIVRLDQLKRDFYTKENDAFHPPTCHFEPTENLANNVSGNTVPGESVQIFDCRIIPEYDFDEFLTRFKALADETAKEFGANVTIESLVADPPSHVNPKETPLIEVLRRGVEKIYKVTPDVCGIGGGSVARFLRYAGFNAVLWSTLNDTLHGPNEYSLIKNMIGDSKVFAYVMASE